MNYHAHIYWNNKVERDIAVTMRSQLEKLGCEMGRIHDRPIGPHPTPMYQIKFTENNKEEVVNYIKENRENISVLLHNDTGNDLEDHTQNVEWLGSQIELNLEAFK